MRKALIALYILFLTITPFVAEKHQGAKQNVFRALASSTDCFGTVSSIVSKLEEEFNQIKLKGLFLRSLDDLKLSGLPEELQEQIIIKSPLIQSLIEDAPELPKIIIRDLDHNTTLFNETFRNRLRTAAELITNQELSETLPLVDSGYSFAKAMQKMLIEDSLNISNLSQLANSPYIRRNKIKLHHLKAIANRLDEKHPTINETTQTIKKVLPIYEHSKNLLSLGRYDNEIPAVKVHDQCQWGSCWAYASTAVMEIKISQQVGRAVPLSAEYFYAKYLINDATDIMIYGKNLGNIEMDRGDAIEEYRALAKYFGSVPEEAWKAKSNFTSGVAAEELKQELTSIIKDFANKTRRGKKTQQLVDQYQQKIIDAVEAKSGKLPKEFYFEGENFTPTQFTQTFFPEINNTATFIDTSKHFPSKKKEFTQARHIRDENGDWRLVKLPVELKTLTQKQIEKTLIEKINQQTPAVLMIHVPENGDFINYRTGEMKITDDQPSLKTDGGHAVVAIGYELDHNGRVSSLKILNSWGKDTADNGFFHMDSEFFKKFARDILLYSDTQ